MKYHAIFFACEEIPSHRLRSVFKKRAALAASGLAAPKRPILVLSANDAPLFGPNSYPPELMARLLEQPFPSGEYLSLALGIFSANLPVLLSNTHSKKSLALTARLQDYCLGRRISYFTCLY